MMFRITGVPAVNAVRRIRRIDVLDRDDQKHSYDRSQPKKSFKAVLNRQLNDSSATSSGSFNVKI